MLMFTALSVGCALVALFFFSYLFWIFYERDTKETKVGGVIIFHGFISLFCGVGFCVGMVVSIRQVFRPFWQDLDDVSRDELALEFEERT